MKKLTKDYKVTPHFVLIEMLGTNTIKSMFQITSAAIFKWRNKGEIPKDKFEIIKYKQPKIYKEWVRQMKEQENK